MLTVALELAERARDAGEPAGWPGPNPGDGTSPLWQVLAFAAVEAARPVGEDLVREHVGAGLWGRLVVAHGRHRAWLDRRARRYDDAAAEQRAREYARQAAYRERRREQTGAAA